jgi:rhodanese-related sulfurtransferase
VLQCKSGGRSAKAARTLAALGFTRLYSLDGGINGWAQEVDPRLPTY